MLSPQAKHLAKQYDLRTAFPKNFLERPDFQCVQNDRKQAKNFSKAINPQTPRLTPMLESPDEQNLPGGPA